MVIMFTTYKCFFIMTVPHFDRCFAKPICSGLVLSISFEIMLFVVVDNCIREM